MVGHSYKTTHLLNTTFAINQKGQQRKVSLMMELKRIRCPNRRIKCFLLGVIVLFGYSVGRVTSQETDLAILSRHFDQNFMLKIQ